MAAIVAYGGGQGPIEISARVNVSGGKVAFPESEWGSLAGHERLTIFVHGYNVGKSAAREKWITTHRELRSALRVNSLRKLVLYYWPGDASSNPAVSTLSYFTRVDVAVGCGQDLAQLLTETAAYVPKLSVKFVGHSLGCRLVLEAARNLRNSAKVEVMSILLMAAAVPEGLCEDNRLYADSVAAREVILYSSEDADLRRWFKRGQAAARRWQGEISPGPHEAAVGFTGGPATRWKKGEKDSCGLDHGDYWTADYSIQRIAKLYGSARERLPAEKRTRHRKTIGS